MTAQGLRAYFVARGILVRPGWKPVAICGWALAVIFSLLATGYRTAGTAFDQENARLRQMLREQPRVQQEELYRATLCPPDWKAQIIQRYDDRDRRGRIIKKTWIRKCI